VFFLSNISTIRYVVMFLPALMVPTLASADETMSLKQGVAYAVAHNRMLAVAESRVDKANAEADIVTGRMLPSVHVSTGFARSNSPMDYFGSKLLQRRITAADLSPAALTHPSYINNYRSRLGLSMPVFAGGALWAGRARAKHHAEASTLNFEYRKQQLIYQTIVAFVQSSQTKAQVEANEKAVQAAEKRWQDVQALKKRGMAINSDVMDAHVHLLRTQVALDEARAMHANSIESLRLVLGMNASLTPAVADEPRVNFATESPEQLMARATERRPDLQALENELKAAESARTESQAAYLPQVNLMAAQEWNNETFGLKNRNTMIGASVTMNLFAGGSDRARVRVAESERVALSLQIEDKRQEIGNEVAQALRSLNTAEKRLESEQKALEQTSESLRIKSMRHAQGLEKTSDLLDAQVSLDVSRVAIIRAKYDVVIAQAALQLAAGTLDEGVVQ